MGALRAVECMVLGMVGIGQVWRDYQDGRLTGDDEVALVYEPETFTAATVPLVNVRALARTLRGLGAPEASCASLVEQAKAVHFRDRSWTLLRWLVERLVPAGSVAALPEPTALLQPQLRRAWDIKLCDAELAVRLALAGPLPRQAPVLEPAPVTWQSLIAGAGA